jgi:putative two-component system response regulator
MASRPHDQTPSRPAPGTLLGEMLRASPPRLVAHHRRVGRMSAALARRSGCSETEALEIGRAGALHNIGMALLPPELVDQPGLLSTNEKELVHRHSRWGQEILDMAVEPGLKLAALVALQHHERWDGSGYPCGLAGGEICLGARIVAICAVYDALRHPRPGKAPLSHRAAVRVLCEGDAQSGARAFDPALRDVFVRFQDEFRLIAEGWPCEAMVA